MDGNMFRDFGKAMGVYAGAFFGVVVVICLVVGGYGWWSLLGWPASIALGYVGGSILDRNS